ncbi:hypothetical protein PG993_005823 [Apiospora rasikravindrae]|uniref:Uncharacterized protein n=1 Tax=Apiospora rasikravindrae TaxID=990691 RepID=A0ABR1T9V9_9PEZI
MTYPAGNRPMETLLGMIIHVSYSFLSLSREDSSVTAAWTYVLLGKEPRHDASIARQLASRRVEVVLPLGWLLRNGHSYPKYPLCLNTCLGETRRRVLVWGAW